MKIKCTRCNNIFEQQGCERICGCSYKERCKSVYQKKHSLHFIANSYIGHIKRNFQNPIYQFTEKF